MSKSLSSILTAIPLACLVLLSACNNGVAGSTPGASSGAQPPGGPSIPQPNVVTACGATVRTAGNYSLDGNLTTPAGAEPCITIANVNNVTLNCNGNSISGAGEYGISVLNVNGLTIKNCDVATGIGDGASVLLSLNNVNGGTVTGSTFGSNQSNLGGVFISESSNVTFGSPLPRAPANPSVSATANPAVAAQLSNAPAASNTVYGFLSDANNVGLVIEGNALTSGTSSAANPFVIGIFGGKSTHVVNNTVNGLGNPLPIGENGNYYYNSVGSDDDILIEDETGPGSLISGNLLVNTFDCGIETVGFMKDITLSNNFIDTVGTGIGGWYYLSVSNAEYAQNVLTNIEYMGIRYARYGGLRAAGARNLPYFFYNIPADMPAESTVNFTQNQFSGNALSQPLVFLTEQVGSIEAVVYSSLSYATSPELPGTDPTPEQFITVKNLFANNSFGQVFRRLTFAGGQRWTYTSDDVIDGGGNICSGSQTFVPAVSPTFGDQTVALSAFTPIACGSGN
jgi:hypothetical protein